MTSILIIDTDLDLSQQIARELEHNSEFECIARAVTSSAEAYTLISQATTAFDILLIGEDREPGIDHIDVLRELQQLSPESDVIVIAEVGDHSMSARALRAGAKRHIHKPIDLSMLLQEIHTLYRERAISRERQRLKILIDIAQQAQRARHLEEVGKIIVQSSLRFGFQRARLWRRSPDGNFLIGLAEAGNQGLDSFLGFTMPIGESIYVSTVLQKRKPVIFHGENKGKSYLHHNFVAHGFQAPTGEWICLPLWSGERSLGMLALDNYDRPRPITREHRQELTLLGEHIAIMLERSLLDEQLRIQNEISKKISNRAATGDLDQLLCEVRHQLGRLVDVRNFMIVLHDQDKDVLDFRLTIEHGQAMERDRRPLNTGIVGHIIARNRSLLLEKGGTSFREKHNIELFGTPSRCWLGVVLRIEGKAIGAIVVQSYEHEHAFSEQDRQLLIAVADQVAGAIQTAHLKEAALNNNSKLSHLQRAGEELLRLAEDNEQWLWHAGLTVATANYGLEFNRAMLLLLEKGETELRGHMGIGHLDQAEARRAWEQDTHDKLSFDDYVERLRTDQLPPSDVGSALRDLVLPLQKSHNALSKAIETGQRTVVASKQVASQMPPEFIQRFGTTNYAVLPIQAGNKRIGVLVVDNIHNGQTLQPARLNQLETLLTQAALVHQHLRQRQASDRLAKVSRQLLEQATSRPLRDTLHDMCAAAQVIAGADCVLIYPLTADSTLEQPRYDNDHTAHIGLQQPFLRSDKLSPNGMTSLVLGSLEPIIAGDVTRPPWNELPYTGHYTFREREQVRALLAMSLTDDTDARLGVIYLNYRTTQTFNARDIERLRDFAALASTAIRASRAAQAVRQGLDLAESLRQAREFELQILSHVLQEALRFGTDRQAVAGALIDGARRLLDRLDLHAAKANLILRDWETLHHPSDAPREVGWLYYMHHDTVKRTEHPRFREGFVGEALRTGQDQRIDDVTLPPWSGTYVPGVVDNTRSELDVLIRQADQHILGFFNIESPNPAVFTDQHHVALQRLAAVAALALDNLRRQENLRGVLDAAQLVVAPQGLKATLDALLLATKQVAPEVAVVTTWYKDPEQKMVIPGPHFGVRDPQPIRSDVPTRNSVVNRLMSSREPIFATDVFEHPTLVRRFAASEGIRSTAALPLLATEDSYNEPVGALFFNYREPHEFTPEEQVLFPILATIAAAAIRDAGMLEALKKERRRLEAAAKITEAAGTALDLNTTLRAIMQQLNVLFPRTQSCILTYDQQRRVLLFTEASQSFYPHFVTHGLAILPLEGQSIVCRVARKALHSKQDVLDNVDDVWQDNDYMALDANTRSEICLALVDGGGTLLGVLALESSQPNAFAADAAALLRSIGRSVSIAIERGAQIDRLRFQSAVASMTAWVAETAHDINAAVSSILRKTYWLREKQLPGHLLNELEQIEHSANQLTAITNAPSNPRSDPIAIDRWLREHTTRILAERDSPVEPLFDLCCPNTIVDASHIMLGRVLQHLIRNALEAMAHLPEPQLIIMTHNGHGTVEIRIANTAPDIPSHVRERLFIEPVSTKHDDHNSVKGGRGLLIVRWALEAMGGSIQLLSKPDERFVRFGLTLPVASPTPAAAP